MTTPSDACRVLVVDDCSDVADSVALVLALRGYDVRTAYDAESALAIAQEYAPDVVILDLLLSDADGYVLARAFRSDPRWRKVFLIAYTGDGTSAARERCAAAGFDVYVLKPVDAERLVEIVARSTDVGPSEARRFRLYSGSE